MLWTMLISTAVVVGVSVWASLLSPKEDRSLTFQVVFYCGMFIAVFWWLTIGVTIAVVT